MYKTRITQWGLDKNNKEHEMRAIVHKRKRLGDQGKASTFRVRGRQVDYKDVARYWERKGLRIEDVIAQRAESTTPEAVKCFTPLRSPITTPESIAIPERMLVIIRDYFKGSFERGTWLVTDPRLGCETTKVQEDALGHLWALKERSLIASYLFNNNRFAEGGQSLISATARIGKILLAEHPMTLTSLFSFVAKLFQQGRHEIALTIVRHFSALADILVGERHPLRSIYNWLSSTHPSQLMDVIVRCSRSMVDHFEHLLGASNWFALDCRLTFIQQVDIENDTSQKKSLLQDLLRRVEATLGSLDVRTCEVRIQLAWNYLKDLEHVEALRLGWDIAALAQRLDSSGYRTLYHAESLSIVAYSQYRLVRLIWHNYIFAKPSNYVHWDYVYRIVE